MDKMDEEWKNGSTYYKIQEGILKFMLKGQKDCTKKGQHM